MDVVRLPEAGTKILFGSAYWLFVIQTVGRDSFSIVLPPEGLLVVCLGKGIPQLWVAL
jgi:hypothetical protein